MKRQRLLSTGEVCALLSTDEADFPRKTLDNWCRAGIIRPAVDNGGTGNHRVFNLLPDVLAIAVGRGLRMKGFTLEAAGNVTEALLAHDADTLLNLFATGKHFLMIVNDEVAPVLFTKAAVLGTFTKYAPGATDLGLHPIAIDVKHLYDNMLSVLDEMKKHTDAKTMA